MMMNWNNDMSGYNKILSDIFRQMEQYSTNVQNEQLHYVDPNPPVPPETIDLTFQEITEDQSLES